MSPLIPVMASHAAQGTNIPKPGPEIKEKASPQQNFFGYLTRFSYILRRAAEIRSGISGFGRHPTRSTLREISDRFARPRSIARGAVSRGRPLSAVRGFTAE
jgi:hypothetical protein